MKQRTKALLAGVISGAALQGWSAADPLAPFL